MREIPIHPIAILGAALAKMAIGAAWYSRALFLKRWMSLASISEAQMKQGFGKAIVVDLIGSLLMAFVLVHAIRYAGAATALQGLTVGFLNWLGFVAVATITAVTHEKKPLAFFWLNNGYLLTSLLVMGAILAVWG